MGAKSNFKRNVLHAALDIIKVKLNIPSESFFKLTNLFKVIIPETLLNESDEKLI